MKRWLKWAGIAFGGLTLLIVALYLEENWRGARLWAQTKAQFEAKGFNFDPKSLIPPPVPDEQNFASSVIWRHLEQYKAKDGKENFKVALFSVGTAAQAAAKKAGKSWLLGNREFASDPNLFTTDAEAERTNILAAMERPHCRFNIDYDYSPPYGMPVPQVSSLMKLSQALKWHALLSLQQGKTDEAAKDIIVCLRLASGSKETPLLIMGLVGLSMDITALSVIWQGIESHAWTDEQLAQFQKQLGKIDSLKTYHTNIHAELLLSFLPTLDLMQYSPKMLREFSSYSGNPQSLENEVYKAVPLRPIAWITNPASSYDQVRSQACHFYLDQLIPVIDPVSHRFFPERIPNFERLETSRPLSYARLVLSFTLNGLAPAPSRFSDIQSRIDLAQVACGLERYRLANGKYPATLAELEPKFIERVPHDLCTGEPLHYRVEADGDYALYSVGFNGVDDGGQIVMKKESATLSDSKQGDWVWPRSKR